MLKSISAVLITCLVFGLLITGCGPKKETSIKEAISVAKTMETAKEQADYMLAQAKAFYNSKQFQDAIDSALYILQHLDKDSQVARDMIQKAQDAITQQAKAAADAARKKIEELGK